jgi:polyisoprenoid-binding protein YceI
MATYRSRTSRLLTAAAMFAFAWGTGIDAQAPLALSNTRISIAGTSNVHDYSATTTVAKVTRVQLGSASAGPEFWQALQMPGGLAAFEIAIPAESLKSSKEGLDKNMYKALKTKEHADIVFRLAKIEPGPAGTLAAAGTLRIAGVEREVTLPLKAVRTADGLAVSGAVDVLMTDFGIAPPKAMLGMVKADPKIKVTFEVVLGTTTT